MERSQLNVAARFFVSFSFSIAILSFVTRATSADVGPAISNQTQKESAPVTRAIPQQKAPVRIVEEQEEEEAYKGWFESTREVLRNEAFEIHPRFRSEYVLDSNVLLESDDRKLDSIFREIPGVEIEIPLGDHRLKADYEAHIERFAKFSKENDENQFFTSEAAFNFTDLYIRANESLTQTSSRSGTTFTDRIPRFEHDVDTVVGYKFNRFTVEGGYGHFYRSFDSTIHKSLNYRTHDWTGTLFMDLTEKTKIFVDYELTKYNYVKAIGRDGYGHQISGGIEGALFPKTTLYSKFGYERIDYEGDRNDSDNFVSEVGVLYKPLSRTAIDVGWARSTEQATFATADDYVQDKLFTRLRQRFTEKVSGEANIAYLNQDYQDFTTTGARGFMGERNDDVITVDVKTLYQFTDWFGVDIKYEYSRRDSNAPVFDFTNNILSVGAELKV